MACIFVHGLGQDSSSFDKVLSCLGKEDRFFVPDLVDFLQGSNDGYAELYRRFSDYCNQFSEKLCLCGLSLGAILCLQYALEYPKKVHSLILIGAQYKMPRMLLCIQSFLFRFLPEQFFKESRLSKDSMMHLMKTMETLDFSSQLGQVCCKTLILCGEKDPVNKKAAKGLSRGIPHACAQVVRGAGHEVNTDAPEELAEIIRAFFFAEA